MTTADPDDPHETEAELGVETETEVDPEGADARSTVTSQREVKPTHAGPGTNWAAVVVAVIAVLAAVLIGWVLLVA